VTAESDRQGEPEYVFRHALTQDVAYASLLQSERRRLHALIGAALEELHAGRLEERAQELVYHFTRGEVWDRVVRYAREAAERAAALCVDDKAVEYYETALAALGHLAETPETVGVGIDVRLAMRAPLWRGGHPERLAVLFREAEALANRHGLTDRLDAVYAFFVQYHWARGEHGRALEYARRCLEGAEARGDLGLRVTGLFYSIHCHFSLGDCARALEGVHELLGLLEGPRAAERLGLSGLPYSGACGYGAECLAELGDSAGALALLDRGQRVADAANRLYSQMLLAAARGAVLVAVGRFEEAISLLEATARTRREKRFVGQLINALKHLGLAYIEAGRPADAIAPEEESIELQNQAAVSVGRGIMHTALARAYLELGDLERAERAVQTALGFSERQLERGCEGWARLAAAKIAHRRDDPAAAARHLGRAQAIAEELGLRALLEQCRAAGQRL
jgi:tetratricopeptide (TPR) repeat protein